MDWHKRKRVRTMKKVLRNHGAPVPKGGCMLTLAVVAVSSLMLTGLGSHLLF